MKNTSRRSFGKQLAGAIAALPVASLALSSSAQDKKNRSKAKRSYFNQHDTPPPLTFNDGSFEIEASHQLNEAGVGPWFYTSAFGGKTEIQHIRVIHGSGELVYQNLDAAGSIIILELVRYGTTATLNTLQIAGGAAVSIKSDVRLSEPPRKNHGRRQWKRVHPFASDYEFRIQRIRIQNSRNYFEVDREGDSPGSADEFCHEYKVLVWLE